MTDEMIDPYGEPRASEYNLRQSSFRRSQSAATEDGFDSVQPAVATDNGRQNRSTPFASNPCQELWDQAGILEERSATPALPTSPLEATTMTLGARLVVWGAGELGGRVARSWAADAPAWGFTRTPTRHAALSAHGIEPRLGSPAAQLAAADRLLLCLPGHAAQADALTELSGLPAPSRAVLISSTGFYGTPSGRIDESAPAGSSARAQAIAGLEQRFRQWTGARGVILRLGGLYRPGRGPFAALARRGEVPPGPPDRPLALVSYRDAAQAVESALSLARPAPVYLVVVPPCPTRQAFYAAACARLGMPPPRFGEPGSGGGVHYDVSRMRRDLLAAPRDPDWHAALE